MRRCLLSLPTVLLAAITSLSSCVRNENHTESDVTRPQILGEAPSLDEVLRSGSVENAARTLDAVKTRGFAKQDIQAVASAWLNRPAILIAYAKQNDRDLVTVSLADVLLQAAANGAWDLDLSQREMIRSALREIAEGTSWPASVRAISAIAFIDDPETTAFLADRAIKNSDQYRAVVVALSLMCDRSASESLARLADRGRNSNDKTFLLSTQEKYRKLKEETSLCERRARLARVPTR